MGDTLFIFQNMLSFGHSSWDNLILKHVDVYLVINLSGRFKTLILLSAFVMMRDVLDPCFRLTTVIVYLHQEMTKFHKKRY